MFETGEGLWNRGDKWRVVMEEAIAVLVKNTYWEIQTPDYLPIGHPSILQ